MSDNLRMPGDAGDRAVSKGMAEILRTSCRSMAEKGFHGTSMRDLAQATGRSVSGLYHHFRSKEDLLFLINYHGFTTLNNSWAQLEELFDSPEERLYAFIFFHTGYFVEHMDEMKVMTWGTQVMNLEKARVIQSLKNRYADAVKRIVRDACESDETSALDSQRLERLTFLLFGMMNWIFSWYSDRRHGDVADLARDIYGIATLGLRADNRNMPNVDATEAVVRRWFRDDKAASMWLDR